MQVAQGYEVSYDSGLSAKADLPARPVPLRFYTKYDFMNTTCRFYSHLIEELEACTTQLDFS